MFLLCYIKTDGLKLTVLMICEVVTWRKEQQV